MYDLNRSLRLPVAYPEGTAGESYEGNDPGGGGWGWWWLGLVLTVGVCGTVRFWIYFKGRTSGIS